MTKIPVISQILGLPQINMLRLLFPLQPPKPRYPYQSESPPPPLRKKPVQHER